MHAFFVTFVSLLAILPLVLSTPIPAWSSTVVNKPAVDDEASRARVAAYHEADARAKEMVDKMVKVANSDKPEHQKIVKDAFGSKADQKRIKEVIHNLDTKQVQIDNTDEHPKPTKNGLVASTPANRPHGPGGPIRLGQEFYKPDSSRDFRAGTLIHEATHQQSNTGDLISKENRIIGSLESQEDSKKQENGKPHNGYHVPGPPLRKIVPTSEADLSDKYKNNRDHIVKNLEENADSYRVFAHLCSQPGVVRRDIELFSRALEEADDDELAYLSKRSSCALPKDYFKKKAAAKAGTADKGIKPLKPSSHPTKGTTKQASHFASPRRTSKSGASGVKTHMSTKPAKFISHVAKGASKRTSLASHRYTSKRGASGAKSHVSTKSTKPLSHLAKGAAMRTSHASPKSAHKSVVNALRGNAVRIGKSMASRRK